MKRTVAALAVIGVLGATSVALAQTSGTGWYTGLKAGLNQVNDAELSGTGASTLRITSDYDLGFGIAGFGGYDFGNWRAEFEVGHRRNSVDKLNIGNDGGIPAAGGAAAQSGSTRSGSGSIEALSFMGNALYDIGIGSALEPYVGAGLGFARVKLNNLASSNVTYSDSADWRFAYQVMAGAAYWLSENVALTADYRFFGTADPGFSDSRSQSFDGEYQAHSFMVGFVYRYGAPPPPPTPVAAPPAPPPPAPPAPPRPTPPAGPKQFIVFFDFDKSDITAQAQRIINDAAAEWKKTGTARITTTGHADRAGTDRYNQRLSERRAAVVKDALTKQGVPANNIVTVGRGESQPLVPTADGVREPQNRRVEILF